MLFFYIAFVLLFILRVRFIRKGINKDYISKNTTTIINGLFVITIFFSHFKTYLTDINQFDSYLIFFLKHVGQLMVTSFLFFSGYGIYESIKTKSNYMNDFLKKRVLPTFLNFSIAIIIYIIVNILLGNRYSIITILLSFIGYESIGNSNWYMFAIFSLYLMTMFCFSKHIKISNLYKIGQLIALSVIYIFIISRFKDSYYVDTILCFGFGMLYSYFKNDIEKIVFNNYYKCFLSVIIIFCSMYYINRLIPHVYTYNLLGISFILLITIISMKFTIKSSIFTFFGEHVFWIYILQRLPMMVLQGKFNNYIFFMIAFMITIIMSYILKKITEIFWSKYLFKYKRGN